MSKSKSKTSKTSRPKKPSQSRSQETHVKVGRDLLSVGFEPILNLSPESQKVFRAFQSNLLSLISHELRTPLTSVMSSLQVLDADPKMDSETRNEVLKLALKNGEKLRAAMDLLIDFADAESGQLRIRLAEVDLGAVVRYRLSVSPIKDVQLAEESWVTGPALGDSVKLGRIADLCLQTIAAKKVPNSLIQVRISTNSVGWIFTLKEGTENAWDEVWSQAAAAEESGVASPASVFSGVLRSEADFLARLEEGLGAELILAHQLVRMHEGSLTSSRSHREVQIRIQLPVFEGEESLLRVLQTRVERTTSEMAKFSLGWVRVPEGVSREEMRTYLKATLFRSTDGVYWIDSRGLVALLLDDCSIEEAPQLLERCRSKFMKRFNISEIQGGFAECPKDSLDPEELVRIALKRLG